MVGFIPSTPTLLSRTRSSVLRKNILRCPGADHEGTLVRIET
jgi:hypothetical protein